MTKTIKVMIDFVRGPWIDAIRLADSGDFSELRRLILSGTPIPPEYREAVADFVSGARTPTRKKGRKARLTDSQARRLREAFVALTTDDPDDPAGAFRRVSDERAIGTLSDATGIPDETVRDVVKYRKTYARHTSGEN